MADETAVLEEATISAPAEAPSQEQIAPVAVETAAPAEVANEEPKDETPSTPASPFTGKSFDEIEADPEVGRVLKDRLAKQAKSIQDRAEYDRQQAMQRQQAEYYRQQKAQAEAASTHWASNFLRAAQKQAEERGADLDQGHIDHVARSLNIAALVGANEAVKTVAEDYLSRFHPDYRIPQQLNQAYAAAQAAQDVPSQMMAFFAMVDSANRERIERDVRAQIAREQAEESEKTATVEKERRAAQAARQAPKPAGSAQAPGDVLSAAREVLRNPMASQEEKRKAFRAINGFDL